MRKLIAFLVTSLDGYHQSADNGFDWHTVDGEFNDFAVDQLAGADTLLFGRATYQDMAGFWPTASGRTADLMNKTDKVVVSTTLTEPTWAPTRVIGSDVAAGVTALKQRPGGDVLVLGSSRLTASLVAAGLVDQLRVMVMPVVLGAGTSLLAGVTGRLPVHLTDLRRFGNGNVLLNYRPGTPAA
jgi:dihydrofolate reductase